MSDVVPAPMTSHLCRYSIVIVLSSHNQSTDHKVYSGTAENPAVLVFDYW